MYFPLSGPLMVFSACSVLLFCAKKSPPIHSKSGYFYRVSSCYIGEESTFVPGHLFRPTSWAARGGPYEVPEIPFTIYFISSFCMSLKSLLCDSEMVNFANLIASALVCKMGVKSGILSLGTLAVSAHLNESSADEGEHEGRLRA
jgi:hypothetical protein